MNAVPSLLKRVSITTAATTMTTTTVQNALRIAEEGTEKIGLIAPSVRQYNLPTEVQRKYTEE